MQQYSYFAVPGIRISDRVTESRVISYVSVMTGVNYIKMQNKCRKRELVEARHISMYLLFRIMNLKHTAIGKMFGGRDHTTSMHAIKAVQNLIDTDEKFRTKVDKLITEILNNKHND